MANDSTWLTFDYDKLENRLMLHSLDEKLWIHSQVGDGWLPQYNSWYAAKAEKTRKEIDEDFTDVSFD